MSEVINYAHFILPICALGAAIVTSVMSMTMALFALRAKGRLKRMIDSRALVDQKLQRLRTHASSEKLSELQVEIAREKIEEIAASLSKDDRHYVELGLRQSSANGAVRYLRDVLTSPSAPT